MSLEISNASPIQFWLTGKETFNQKEVCSIYPVCFCQQIDPSDTLVLDIRDITDATNHLLIYKDDGTLWHNYTFASTGFDHHQFALIIGANGDWDTVLNRKLIFKICNNGNCQDTLVFSDTNVWVNTGTAFSSKTETTLTKNNTGAGDFTYGAYQPFVYSSGLTMPTLPIGIVITNNGSGDQISITISVKTSIVGSVVASHTENIFSDYSGTINYELGTLIGDGTVIVVTAFTSGIGGVNVSITVPIDITVFNGEFVAQSDCVDIIEDDCTKLISYSNSTDFAGLGFPSLSPSFVYYLRIPAIFYDEQFPQEQEDLELSTDEIITLWSKMEGKKLLDIGYMPFYMHKKLQMILMMDSIVIDEIDYRKRDEYIITASSSKRSALRKASVLLSEKDFIVRNLL